MQEQQAESIILNDEVLEKPNMQSVGAKFDLFLKLQICLKS